MKHYIFIIALISLAGASPSYAQEKPRAPLTPPAEEKPLLKTEPLEVRKQKAQEELALTTERLEAVIARTQTAIDLLAKNGKDTTSAQKILDEAKNSLEKAIETLAAFTGKEETNELALSTNKKVLPRSITPTALTLRDQVKTIQDHLKDARTSLIESIQVLKESLTPPSKN